VAAALKLQEDETFTNKNIVVIRHRVSVI
jgi:hypothetical protein